MANLQVRDMDDNLYKALKALAKREKRSISQEVVYIIERYLSSPKDYYESQTEAFLDLTWKDDRTADEIINDLRSSRENSGLSI